MNVCPPRKCRSVRQSDKMMIDDFFLILVSLVIILILVLLNNGYIVDRIGTVPVIQVLYDTIVRSFVPQQLLVAYDH